MMLTRSNPESVDKCVAALNDGKIIIIPTDTVYGFSGIVDDVHNTADIIKKIKGRAETKPFIQLIGTPEEIFDHTADEIPETLLKLWPGPLTVIVHNKYDCGTTAYRCPDDPWLIEILKKVKHPVYSTSANRSGSPIIEKIDLLEKEFSNEVDLIIDDGDRVGGQASTIVTIDAGTVKVLRQGSVVIS